MTTQTSVNTKHFKQLFIELKKNALTQINLDKKALEPDKGDELDQLFLEKELNLKLKLQGRQQFFIKKIDQALNRIAEGEFGICEDCGSDIETKRLMARPTACLCISCKEEQEREETHILYQKKSHTLGKEIISDNVVNLSKYLKTDSKNIESSLSLIKGQQ